MSISNINGVPIAGQFIDRGDPAGNDFTQATLTTDENWNDLDLSSIVTAGAVAVLIQVAVSDGGVGNRIQFRKNGNSNDRNVGSVRTQVANIVNDGDLIIPCDSGRIIEYHATNTAWTVIVIKVKGWWM